MGFWKAFLASLSAGVVLLLIFFLTIGGMIAIFSEPKGLKVEQNTVLHLQLNESLGDYTSANINPSALSIEKKVGLYDLVEGLKLAETDNKIKGIFLNCDGVSGGYALTKELREALDKFQSSGKFIIAYSENYTAKSYYLSSVANELYVHPKGMLEFLGIGAELMFFKNALEKLAVEVQIIRGSNNKFKSAVEPFLYDKMSDENREQTSKFIGALWNQMLVEIGEKRGLTAERLNEIADSVHVRQSGDAVGVKLADGAKFYDEILDILVEKSGAADVEGLNLLSFTAYTTSKTKDSKTLNRLKEKNIALIFGEGEIVDGNGDAGEIGGNTMAKHIRNARLNDTIKAVVLRINSPGGSALASDVIWREVVLTKAVKPVIVSMGDVAASGGYYIACAADRIFAQPNTITGSIGVFGMVPYTGKMFEEKLGITFSRVETNAHSKLSMNKKLTDEELDIFQEVVDEIYDDFITKVSAGRGMTKENVDSIAQGRVWAGTDAKEIGLVDEYGGMWDAINYAAEKSGLSSDSISLKIYPEIKENMWLDLLEMAGKGGGVEMDSKSKFEQQFMDIYQSLSLFKNRAKYQARLPYLIWVE